MSAVLAASCGLMFAGWLPHYLTWPWWPDIDSFAAIAQGWDAGIRPYRDVSIFMAHGSQDPVVPMSLAAQSCGRLQQLGYAVEWHEYPMAHAVCPQEIADIREFLLRVLP